MYQSKLQVFGRIVTGFRVAFLDSHQSSTFPLCFPSTYVVFVFMNLYKCFSVKCLSILCFKIVYLAYVIEFVQPDSTSMFCSKWYKLFSKSFWLCLLHTKTLTLINSDYFILSIQPLASFKRCFQHTSLIKLFQSMVLFFKYSCNCFSNTLINVFYSNQQ